LSSREIIGVPAEQTKQVVDHRSENVNDAYWKGTNFYGGRCTLMWGGQSRHDAGTPKSY
jgi:hypothetical protein